MFGKAAAAYNIATTNTDSIISINETMKLMSARITTLESRVKELEEIDHGNTYNFNGRGFSK